MTSGEKGGRHDPSLFGADGFDETAIDDCELYCRSTAVYQQSIVTEPNEDMGRIRSAENFVRSINGKKTP